MEAGMKKDIKRHHNYTKTKELFSFDDGLAECQSAFIVVASPIQASLTALNDIGKENESEDGILMLSRFYWRMPLYMYFLAMPTSG